MQNVTRTRPKRSLTRRLLAPVTALALLSGGGYGAYHFYGTNPDELEPTAENNFAAHSAPTDQEELQLLFSSDELEPTSPEPKPVKLKSVVPTSKDRYALSEVDPPKLPPLVMSDKTDEALPEQNTAPAPTSSVGDRYAPAITIAKLAESAQDEPSEVEPSVAAKPDVARGQEPSGSQIRIATPPPTSELDARAAFGQALAQAPKTPSSNAPVAATPSNDLASALQASSTVTAQSHQRRSSTIATKQLHQSIPLLLQHLWRSNRVPPLHLICLHRLHRSVRPRCRRLLVNPFGAPLLLGLMASRTPTTPPAPMERNVAPQALAPQGLTPTPGIANHPGTGRPGESLLEGAQSPSVTIQKLSPEEIQVGKRCTFAIRIQNSGQRTAQNVQIRDEVPLGTELVGTAPRATVSGTEVVWDLGTLSPGEERTVEMELLPKEEGELGSVATVSLAAQASAKSRCTRPELALRLTSEAQVHVGDQHIVQIELSNPAAAMPPA